MEAEHRHIAFPQLADDEVRVNVEGLGHDQDRPLTGHEEQDNPDSPQRVRDLSADGPGQCIDRGCGRFMLTPR